MSRNLASDEQIDDLHLLMASAVLCGQRGVEAALMPIFDAWADQYPSDALANIGRGLFMIGNGNPEAGIAIIEDASNTATTRADQAREVLASLRSNLAGMSG